MDGATTTTRTYLYDGEDIILEYATVGVTITSTHYVHGPGIDEPLALVEGGQPTFYHADGLGSIVALSNASGTIVQRYEYDSFGNRKDMQNTIKQPYTYTGREYDQETGLYYYRARYYDAMEGRFISKDPIGFAGGDVNLYNYVQNNPIMFTDPTGLYWFRQDWQTDPVVGREGIPFLEPGDLITQSIEDYVPAGRTFGELHDSFVGIATAAGLPDWLVNIRSMPTAYNAALILENVAILGNT